MSWRGVSAKPQARLGDDLANNLAVHVGETKVTAAIAVGEALVVKAKLVQDGGVQVVDVGAFFLGAEAELVGGAVSHAPLEAAAGEPQRKAPVIVIAAVAPLRCRRAPELA